MSRCQDDSYSLANSANLFPMGSHKQTNKQVPGTRKRTKQAEKEGRGKKLSNVGSLMNHPGISIKVLLHGRFKRTYIRNRFHVRRQIIPIQGSLVKEWVFGVWTKPWYVEVERTRSGCMWMNIWNFGIELVEIWWAKGMEDVKHVVEP